MAQMLEQSGAVAAGQFMEQVLPLAQVSPEVLDKIDADQLVDELAQRLGVPASVVRSDEQVAALRKEREEREAEREAKALAQSEVEQMAKMGGMKTEGTLAGALLGAAGSRA